jgi:hypothetical protein
MAKISSLSHQSVPNSWSRESYSHWSAGSLPGREKPWGGPGLAGLCSLDVFGGSAHGVERHVKFAGDLRAVQVGSKQAKHCAFAFGAGLDRILASRRSIQR